MADKKKTPNALAIALRAAIEASGKSRYAIAKEADIDEQRVHQFMGGADLRLETASAIVTVLGLELRPKRGRVPRKRPGGASG